MFDRRPPEKTGTELAVKGLVIFAVGIGLSFGLCGVSLVVGVNGRMPMIAIGVFLFSILGLFVCLVWLVVAIFVDAFKR